ncbi:MAG: spore cortex biosynthesis protein YabQ [Clostridia bacterium]|nr:spore cortex biosynthesis protein YabQ [Clostridia bacterium]
MLYETSSQALEAPLMVLAGMGMGGVSLLFQLVRHVLCAGVWLSLICDMLMGVIWSAIFCGALVIANRGNLRLYHILSACAGAALFQAALGVPVRTVCGKLCIKWKHMADKARQNRLIRALIK